MANSSLEVDQLYPLDPSARSMTRAELRERVSANPGPGRLCWIVDRELAQTMLELHQACGEATRRRWSERNNKLVERHDTEFGIGGGFDKM